MESFCRDSHIQFASFSAKYLTNQLAIYSYVKLYYVVSLLFVALLNYSCFLTFYPTSFLNFKFFLMIACDYMNNLMNESTDKFIVKFPSIQSYHYMHVYMVSRDKPCIQSSNCENNKKQLYHQPHLQMSNFAFFGNFVSLIL